MKNTVVEFKPGRFTMINGINYFRLENGKIAVETTGNVIIDSSGEDTVELITLEDKLKSVNFWRVNNNFYALASSSGVTIPGDTTFVDMYSSDNYPEGMYVKFMNSGKCGILYVSETEVSTVINLQDGYTEICFENNLFYANCDDVKNRYQVIGESGKLLGAYSSKCKKLEGYMLFYDESKIFVDASEYEIPSRISSVEVIKMDKITFVRVVTEQGIYYYTTEISYLFGPIQNDVRKSIDENSCFVQEVVEGKVVKVFAIKFADDTYVCKSISCNKGIDVYPIRAKECFFMINKELYVFVPEKMEFILLIKDIGVDRYSCYLEKYEPWCRIIGFKEDKPICLASYDFNQKGISKMSMLHFIGKGWNDDYICKEGENEITIITKSGRLRFSSTGRKCFKKVCYTIRVYVFVEDNDEIGLYSEKGKPIICYEKLY